MIRAAALLAAVTLALAGCSRFHAGRLPNAPADATFVEIDGVHVRYRDQGSGPAVVMIHGFAGSLEHWAGVQPVVAGAHRVITIDLKGFGFSSRPDGDYSPAAQAQLVWRVLDALGVRDAAIVGHSYGASVALSMAVAQPERTRRVALYSAYVYDEQVPSFFRWAQQGQLSGKILFGLFYKERIEDRAPLAYHDERYVTQARVERAEADLDRPGTTAAALASVRGHHFARLHEELVGFAKPVLLLWGAQDLVTPVSYGHRLAAELANAEIEVYERCGHVPMVEAKHRSTRALLAFLAKDDARDDQPHGRPDNENRPGPGRSDGGDGRDPGGDGDDRGLPGGQGGGGAGSGARSGGTLDGRPLGSNGGGGGASGGGRLDGMRSGSGAGDGMRSGSGAGDGYGVRSGGGAGGGGASGGYGVRSGGASGGFGAAAGSGAGAGAASGGFGGASAGAGSGARGGGASGGSGGGSSGGASGGGISGSASGGASGGGISGSASGGASGGEISGGASDGASGSGALGASTVSPPATLVRYDPLTFAADLAASGAEMAPRLYAAPREKTEVVIHGILRVRESGLYNLDLDRGLDSRGRPLAPIPLGGGQMTETGDIRARTDLAIYPRGVGIAIKGRIDWLDNVPLGGNADLRGGSLATTPGQRPAIATVRRGWGEVLTPIGTVAAGRMGTHFGLGMAANGGDCEDCDHGDAADRGALITPIAGHLFAVAYDIAARQPFTRSRDGGRDIFLEPSSAVSGPTVAVFKTHSPATLARRADAGLTSVEYAGYYTFRRQGDDVPASYLPTAAPRTGFSSDDLVGRDFSAHGVGGWLRVTSPRARFEAEVAHLRARVGQPSLIPGAEITVPVTSNQLGFAARSAVLVTPAVQLGLDGGYASGDDAPGFGAFPTAGDLAPAPGAFEGAQANPPRDRTVDNFRFSPDYRIDQVLFREIIGTVTDAIYVRPHVRATLLAVGRGRVDALTALIASWAAKPSSTPSGARALGIEIDPELRYEHRDGLAVSFIYGLLLPGAGFDGTMLDARPAQVFRIRVGFIY